MYQKAENPPPPNSDKDISDPRKVSEELNGERLFIHNAMISAGVRDNGCEMIIEKVYSS